MTDGREAADGGSGSVNALDLFCGAGGAAMGLSRAGFDVVGIDHKPQPRYPFHFIQADALNPPVRLEAFDLIWASPPCQAFTPLRWMYNAKSHYNLIPDTRSMLQAAGRPYVIENVPGSPVQGWLRLCGTMFGLGINGAELRRHRDFETSFLVFAPSCRHGIQARVIGVYGGHGRDRRRTINGQDFPVSARQEAMGIDWMTGKELSEAVPPAYSKFIGDAARQWISAEQAP